jgi:sec-independent protein translocase protein TatB
VVFGPRRLPQIGRQIGKLMYEFRKASNDFKFQMEEELRSAEEADRRNRQEERLRALGVVVPAQTAVDSQASEARPGAPAPIASLSPYPGEEQYPPVTEPVAEAQAQEAHPRIQPPSTGEPVPAARPWSLEEELAVVSATDAETSADSGKAPAETGQAAPATEQARHG